MAIKPDKLMYRRKSTNGYEEVTATFECPDSINLESSSSTVGTSTPTKTRVSIPSMGSER